MESHGLDAPLPAAKREQGRLGPPHQTPPANFLTAFLTPKREARIQKGRSFASRTKSGRGGRMSDCCKRNF